MSGTFFLFFFLNYLDYVTPYVAKDDKEEYYYYLNVCGRTGAGNCKDSTKYASACQVKSSTNQNKVTGRFENQTLRCVKCLLGSSALLSCLND